MRKKKVRTPENKAERISGKVCDNKKKQVCVNRECRLRKAGCQSSPSCPGFRSE